MPHEILIYDYFHDYSAKTFIKELNALFDESEITFRVSSDGGDPESAWGMIAKMREYPGKKIVKVDGFARSMGAFFVAAADDVEQLDVSQYLFHRAAYPSWIENDKEHFESLKAGLIALNAHLRALMESKINIPVWEEITGVTLDELFSIESRIDVEINAEQAIKIGLANRTVALTSSLKRDIEARHIKVAAASSPGFMGAKEFTKQKKEMNIFQVKSEHPEVYAQIVQEGIRSERDRVESILAYSEFDIKACIEEIKKGGNVSQAFVSEMTVKGIKSAASKKLEANSPDPLTTDPPKTAEEIEAEKNAQFFSKARSESKFKEQK